MGGCRQVVASKGGWKQATTQAHCGPWTQSVSVWLEAGRVGGWRVGAGKVQAASSPRGPTDTA